MALKKITLLLLAGSLLGTFDIATASISNPKTTQQVLKAAGQLHMPFIENQGQIADPGIAYVADTFACRVAVTRDGQLIYSSSNNQRENHSAIEIKERMVGKKIKIDLSGLDRQPTKVSYFQGRKPSQRHSNLKTYARVGIGRMAPGIHMELKAHGHNVEKLFFLSPGADPADIRMAVEGAQKLAITTNGELTLSIPSGGTMRFTKPVAYQKINGRQRMVPVRYRVHQNSYGFDVGDYDTSQELVIDPLVQVFPIDGSNENAIMDAVMGPQGNVYAAGYSDNRLVVFKLDPQLKNLLSKAYFATHAGYNSNIIRAIAIDGQGNVFVAGGAHFDDFPVTPDSHNTNKQARDGFVTKFSADLDLMLASTLIGSDFEDELFALAINKQNEIYVAGFSSRSAYIEDEYGDRIPFPITDDAFDSQPAPDYQRKSVVAKLDNDLTTVLAATFIGGNQKTNVIERERGEKASCLAIDNEGNVWVAGRTNQAIPVTEGCLGPDYMGDGDVFLSKFDGDLQNLLASTHLGGNQIDAPTDLIIDGQGDLYLLGYTHSGKFPMSNNGYDLSHSNVEEDGFILKISPTVDQILAGTFLGGTKSDKTAPGDDVPAAMALSADEKQIAIVGRTESQSFPITPDSLDSDLTGNTSGTTQTRDDDLADMDLGDGFITILNSDLTEMISSTFIGGQKTEYLDTVLYIGSDLVVAGMTSTGGAGFPLLNYEDEDEYLSGGIHRGVVFLVTTNEANTPKDPDPQQNPPDGNTPATTGASSGGGGGCFVGSSMN